MARPLILHNVPDDELYIGEDGVRRPFAMVFPQQDGPGRSRRAANESGSFGKSTRRSRSKTGTPARREDPTIAGADKIFSSWAATQVQSSVPAGTGGAPQRKQSTALNPGLEEATVPAVAQTRFAKPQEPTEVILRGYRSQQQQYAAISHFEQIAGRICEDYPREPPVESRRYKSELRDPAFTQRRPLTAEERAKVNRADGGEHWVKVTFESAEAADNAIYASPQSILGHLIYAEPYRGIPPTRNEAVPDAESLMENQEASIPTRRRSTRSTVNTSGFTRAMLNPDDLDFSPPQPQTMAVNTAGFTRAMLNPDEFDYSPPRSQTSSRTADTTTVASTIDTGTVSTGTVTGRPIGAFATGVETRPEQQAEDEFCRAIPTVRKVKLLPVEQALLPAPSVTQRLMNHIPMLKWFSGSMIGNEVPRTDNGDFDWDRASLYWKIIFWLDLYFGLFGKEIVSADKDD